MNATAAIKIIPNSYDISSRLLGDVTSAIAEDESKILPGDIILSRARTLTMHSIITLGQIYEYKWDKHNAFQFWSHPAMIVAVKGQKIESRDKSQTAIVKETALVQATVNPNGVHYALLKDFRREYSSRMWIFHPEKFTNESNRANALAMAQADAGETFYDWLKERDLLENESPPTEKGKAPKSKSVKRATYGLLSLASILVSQLFPGWNFRFFNKGQVTCSGFVADLMEVGGYSFDSEIHAFPADVAQPLYAELNVTKEEDVDAWVKGAARLRKQISIDKKLTLKNAKKINLTSKAKWMLAFGVLIAICVIVFICSLIPYWPLRLLAGAIIVYLSIIAAPVIVYAAFAYYHLSFKGIPKLIAMLRPLYWRKDEDLN